MTDKKKYDNNIRPFPVRLYVSALPEDERFYRKWYGNMPKERQKRCDRLKNSADRHRCIAAYSLLALSVSRLLEEGIFLSEDKTVEENVKNGILSVDLYPDGKPYFTDIPVCFSLSHAGERVAAALSPSQVGCDVEKKREQGNLQIAKRFFAKAEYDMIRDSDPQARDECFTSVWTMKESILKCSGEGLKKRLDEFSVVNASGNIKDVVEFEDHSFNIMQYPQENGYLYSVSAICGNFEKDIRRVLLGE